MQISAELERKAVPSQGGYLQSELGGHLFTAGCSWGAGAKPQGRSVQPPSSKAQGTQTHEAVFRMTKSSAQSPATTSGFLFLKGNLPVIPSAATGLQPPQHNKSFKEQSAFILGERSVSRHFCISSLPLLSSSWSKRQDGQALSKKRILQRNVKIDMLT